jgi:membrane-associated phospholipid phosphatase
MKTTSGETGRPARVLNALLELLREIGPFALAGLLGALLFLFLFAWLSEEVFTSEFTSFDSSVALWLHGFANPALDTIFNAFSTIGGVVGIALLTVAAFAYLVWRRHHHAAWAVVVAVIGGVVISEALKFLFQRPRPDLWPGAHVLGFSFPSGHATLSLCLFGMFAWLGWHYIKSEAVRAAWTALMVVLIVMIGLSRIYLGAHYPSDVLAGYLTGGFWLVALLSGEDIYNRLRGERPPERHIQTK